MKSSRLIVLLSLLGATSAQAQKHAAGFCDRISALTGDPSVAAAHWGVSVTTLDGTVLCGINQAQLFRPASNNKLFTTAAALALLGPDRRFTTSVLGEGELSDGVLHGNLRMLGRGDANFGSAELPYVPPAKRPKNPSPEPPTIADVEDLADQIYAKGVRAIQGDVIGDDQWFVWEPYPFGWEVDDLDGSDGAPVSALTIHDNAIEMDVVANPDPAGKAVVTSLPDVPYYAVNNSVYLVDSKNSCRTLLHSKRALGSKTILLFGNVTAAQNCKLDQAIQDPAEYAALALKQALERRGVKITGAAVANHYMVSAPLSGTLRDDPDMDRAAKLMLSSAAPEGEKAAVSCAAQVVQGPSQTVLATHTSARLADDLTFTLKVSQNLHAEIMLRNIGAALSCGQTLNSSLAAVRAFATQIGIDRKDLVLYDGSGLSGHDLIAPRALTGLLVYAATQRWFDLFKAALPVGGVDGTLANRFVPPGSAVRGQVFAKTGTLGESRALSGYITAASGKTLVFSVMVDNHPPTGGADRVAMDKIVEAIAAGN